MIAKIPKKRNDGKSSFRTLVNYIAGDDYQTKDTEQRAIYVNTRNTFSETAWEVAQEMAGMKADNARCKDPAFHYILSFRPEEVPTNAQVDEAVNISLKALGLENCKALYALQNDTGIHHIHVCVCRIDPETGKTIDPAGGWTKKALSKAAKEIEISQGWKILEGRGKKQEEPKLDTKSQDLEAHMGEKSAQRIAFERGAEILRNARSWEELHDRLSEVGLEFRKKGSGAVIVVNDVLVHDVFVKASSIGRDCSLSQLEKRIGEYKERNKNGDIALGDSEGVVCAPLSGCENGVGKAAGNFSKPSSRRPIAIKAEPTKQTATTPQTLSAWQRYQLYKEGYQGRKKIRNEMFLRHKEERKKLKSKQKAERGELFKQSWKGRGNELNMRRGAFAGKHLKEELVLQKIQKAEEQEFGDKGKFLSWRKWLAENDAKRIEELRKWKKTEQEREDAQRESPIVGKIEPIEEASTVTTIYVVQVIDFSGYTQVKNQRKNCYEYSLDGKNVAFADYDKRIDVFKLDESAILASLQLASKKWGSVKISGSEKYLNACMKLAEEHGIRLQVPEEHLKKLEELKAEEPEIRIIFPTEESKETETTKKTEKTEEKSTSPLVNKLKLAHELATHKATTVVNALVGKAYEGTVEDIQHGYLLLRTGKDEITILKESGLKTSPKLGERILVGADDGNGRSWRNSAVKDRGTGR